MPKRESFVPSKPATGITEVDALIEKLPQDVLARVGEIYDTYLKINTIKPVKQLSTDSLDIPNSISSLLSTELGDLHGRYAAWYSYFIDRIKFLRVASTVIGEELRILYAGHFVSYEKGMTVEVKKLKAETEPDYRAMRVHQTRVDAAIAALDEDIRKMDKMLSVLSRETSRREHNAGY